MRYIILNLLLVCTSLFAQTTYHFNSPPGIKWDANLEADLSHYVVYIARWAYNIGTQDTVSINVTDTSYTVPDLFLSEANYFFGVSAVDSSGNESGITWSHRQCYADTSSACWHARYDITPPDAATNLIPNP